MKLELSEKQQALLKKLPGVDRILERTRVEFADVPRGVLLKSAREAIDELRAGIMSGEDVVESADAAESTVMDRLRLKTAEAMSPKLMRVVNATGVVVHTNLGRSILCREAIEHVVSAASGYSNLEFDLDTGRRGERYDVVEDLLCEITGAESALVVNNNAGAVLLSLDTLASGKEVIVSRGELVEIGGSFRIPDVMAKSGCILKEAGTTNRTHMKDYEAALGPETGLLLKVHQSNFAVVGFTCEVSTANLAALGARVGVPVMEDLGSGVFVDLAFCGLYWEPTVQDSVSAGVDIVTFSGDKLLGGPQGGIIVGKRKYVERIKRNPLTRALRIDKMTLAALEGTLRCYRSPDTVMEKIPTLAMIMQPLFLIRDKADNLTKGLRSLNHETLSISQRDGVSRVGGGAMPLQDLPTRCVAVVVRNMSVNKLERLMRHNSPPIIGRIEDEEFVMDLRTVRRAEIPAIGGAIDHIIRTEGGL